MADSRPVYSMGYPETADLKTGVVWYEDPDGKRVEMPVNIAYMLAKRLLIRIAGTVGGAADVLADQEGDVHGLPVERAVELKHVFKELA